MSKWSFEWITDWDEIWSDGFLEQWNTWIDQSWSSHVFFSPDLVKAWVDTYLPLWNLTPLFCIARHGGLTIFLPLLLWKRNWKNAFLRLIIPAGYSDFDYHDPIIAGKREALEKDSFWSSLSKEFELLDLGYDAINIPGIRAEFAGIGTNWHEDEICPYCDIAGFTNPEDFLSTLKKSLRSDLQRQVRRLQEQGELTYHVYSPDDLAESLAILPAFLMFHAKRFPNSYKAPHFHENLLRCGLKKGVVHFSELRLDGTAISWHLGFVDRTRFYYYLPAVNPTFSKFSPGKVHLLRCVEEAIRLSLSVYDHLRGEESYKSGWTKSLEKLSNFVRKKNTISGNVKFFMIEKVKPVVVPQDSEC
jgi:CelD/BcsL family acetyltransferase involved in cellulose biosynthesis